MYGIRRSLDLKAFIRPASVAIIGGSRNPASLTARPRRYLAELGFTGRVTVVNPQAAQMTGTGLCDQFLTCRLKLT